MTAPDDAPPLPLDEAALTHARKWGLIGEDGRVECLRECGRPATLPTLLCRECLAARRRGWR